MPIAEAKQALRRQMRQWRARLPDGAWREAGAPIAEHVLAMPEIRGAHGVLCYVSVRREVSTAALIHGLLEAGHAVAVPRITGERTMEAAIVTGRWVDGPFGIATSDGPILPQVDVCICPGLAFDAHGRRLGYGGGFYDTWLAAQAACAVGLALDGAVRAEVPAEPHDTRMHAVVTPSGVRYATSHRGANEGFTTR